MKPKFKKGDLAYRVGNWDGKGQWFYELVTITSWGKKHGTYTKNGKNSDDRIHINYVNSTPYSNYFIPADGVVDPVQTTEMLAQQFLNYEIESALELCRLYNQQYHYEKLETVKQYKPSVIKI